MRRRRLGGAAGVSTAPKGDGEAEDWEEFIALIESCVDCKRYELVSTSRSKRLG